MRIEKKCWKDYFQLVLDGKKNFDLRLADFKCQEGDILVLKEWDQVKNDYTGREIEKEITFVGKIDEMPFWSKEDIKKYGFQIISFKSSSN